MNNIHDHLYYELLMRSVTAFRAALAGPDTDGAEHDTPTIDDYLIVLRGEKMNLHGWATGHPKLGDAYIQTSLLIHVTQDEKWARTLSRWYRLESPRHLDTSQLSPDADLAGYCIPVGLGGFSAPLHLARRLMELRPSDLCRIASEKGFDEVSKTLNDIAKIWPPKV
ncbi:DUF6634 family protein [Tropicibacter naphthalenivorans]|nr:DUF6634 family protein [Tropicibacter naphthalenivorans]